MVTKSQNRSGKRNEAEFAKSLRSYGEGHPSFWHRRWPDYMDFIAVNKHLRAPRAPADFVAVHFGTYYAIEVKSTRGTRFNHSWIKPHQIQSLRDVKAAGGIGCIVFMHRERPVECWAIDINDYLRIRRSASRAKRRSVKVKEMAKIGVRLPRLRGSFDVRPMFTEKFRRGALMGSTI